MKTVLIVLMSLLLVGSAEWLNDFELAKQKASESNQVILLNFSGSDWCAPCIQMTKEIFEQQAFEEFASENLVLVRADFPRHKKNQLSAKQKEHNEKLAEKYNPNGKFPLTLLVSADGRVLKEWDGYQKVSPEKFIEQVKAAANGK